MFQILKQLEDMFITLTTDTINNIPEPSRIRVCDLEQDDYKKFINTADGTLLIDESSKTAKDYMSKKRSSVHSPLPDNHIPTL